MLREYRYMEDELWWSLGGRYRESVGEAEEYVRQLCEMRQAGSVDEECRLIGEGVGDESVHVRETCGETLSRVGVSGVSDEGVSGEIECRRCVVWSECGLPKDVAMLYPLVQSIYRKRHREELKLNGENGEEVRVVCDPSRGVMLVVLNEYVLNGHGISEESMEEIIGETFHMEW